MQAVNDSRPRRGYHAALTIPAVALLLVAAPWIASARADSAALWTTPLANIASGQAVITPPGNVLAGGCTSVAAGGAVAWSTLNTTSTNCYYAGGDSSGNTYILTVDAGGNPVVESIDSTGNVRWTTPTAGFSAGRASPVIGSSGSVYFSLWNGGNSKVLGLDEKTGAVTLDRSFGDVTGLDAYAGGLVVVLTDSQVLYLGYDGTTQHTYTTGAPISAYQAYSNAGGANGAVFLAGYSGSCGGGVSVAKITPTGLAWTWTDPTARQCSQTALAATPDGGVILAGNESAPDRSADFISISPTGAFRWDHHAAGPIGPAYYGGYFLPIVDVNGDVAMPSVFDFTCTDGSAGPCSGGQVEFVSQQTDSPTFATVSMTDPANGGFGLDSAITDRNRVYLTEQASSGSSLWAFTVPGLGTDYRLALQESLESTPPEGGGTPPSGGGTPPSGGGGGGGGQIGSNCPPPGPGQHVVLSPINGGSAGSTISTATLPAGMSVTLTSYVWGSVRFLPQRGAHLSFKIDCGPNAHRTPSPVPAVTNAHGEAHFTYSDQLGVGTDTISASLSGSSQAAVARVIWAWPASCKHIGLSFFTALKCAQANAMVHTVLQIGGCLAGVASFIIPPAKLLGLIKDGKSLAFVLAHAKASEQPVAKLFYALYRDYGTKYNRGARRGFRSFQELKATFDHLTSAADLMHILPNLWSAISRKDRSEIFGDIADLAGLKPCIDLLSKTVA